MLGPVRITTRASSSRARSLGVTGWPERASSTGWRPSTISSAPSATITGRTWPRAWATSASAATTSSVASARAVASSSAGPRRHPPAQLVEQLVLEPATALIGTQNLGLVVLQLGRHVALGAGEGLAAHVLGRGPRGLGVGDLDAVAEDPVVAHAQTGQPRARALALLQAGDPAPGLGGVAHQRLQRLVPALADDAAVLQRGGRLVDQRGLQGGAQIGEVGQRGPGLGQQRSGQRGARLAHGLQRGQAPAQTHEVAGVGDAEGGPAGQPGQVADRLQQTAQRRARLRRLDQGGDRVVTGADRGGAEQGLQHPLPQQASAHRRDRLVEDAEERVARGAVAGLQQLERAHRGLVERHAVVRPQPLQADQVAEAIALRGAHVGQGGGAGGQPGPQIAEAEDLQRRHTELAAKVCRGVPSAPQPGVAERERGPGLLQPGQQLVGPAQGLRQQDLGGPAQQRRAPAPHPRRGRPPPPRTRRWRRRAGRRRCRRRCGRSP